MTQPARRPPLAAPVVGALLAAACGDPAAPRCSVTVDRFRNDVVVAGTREQAVARVACDRGGTPPLRWSVTDTTLATVDANGVVAGRAPGVVRVRAETAGGRPVRGEAPFVVVPPYEVVVTPRAFDLVPRQRAPFNLSVVPTDFTPPNFPSAVAVTSSDSCVAVVDAGGNVDAGRAGRATLTARLAAAPGVRDSVTVVVGVPASARTFVARITEAETGGAADPRALRGRVTLLVNLLYPNTGGRLEARLGGRPAGTLLLAPPTVPLVAAVRLPVTIDTGARDASGARRFPDGAQTLEVELVVPDLPGLPGCAAVNLGDRDAQPVTVVN